MHTRVLLLLTLCPLSCRQEQAAPRSLTVFAAASTAELMNALQERFEAAAGSVMQVNLASSSALARQIEAGAACDIFISANRQWVDHLITAGTLRTEQVRPLVRNRLVIVVPRGAAPEHGSSAAGATVAGDPGRTDVATVAAAAPPAATDLGAWLHGSVALGDPQHVPAGQYARQALEKLGLWDQVQARVLPAPDVRAALQLVELGEADAGIVYATDARTSPGVRVVAEIPPELHDPAIYYAARCSDSPLTEQFMRMLSDPETVQLYHELGFTPQ